MRPFHNRQPVLLDAERAPVWLNHAAPFADLLVGPPKGTVAFGVAVTLHAIGRARPASGLLAP